MIHVCTIQISSFCSYIKSHKDLHLDQKPNYNFLGHPLNAYHFIRHVAAHWNAIHDEVVGKNVIIEDFKFLAEREKEKLPDLYDVQGGGMFYPTFLLFLKFIKLAI